MRRKLLIAFFSCRHMSAALLTSTLLIACQPESKSRDEAAPKSAPSSAVGAPAPAPAEALTSEQSFKEGMQLLCDSIDKVDANLAPSDMQRAVASWIDANVKNPDVRELFTIMGDVPPDKRAGMMQAAATKAGIKHCAIAER